MTRQGGVRSRHGIAQRRGKPNFDLPLPLLFLLSYIKNTCIRILPNEVSYFFKKEQSIRIYPIKDTPKKNLALKCFLYRGKDFPRLYYFFSPPSSPPPHYPTFPNVLPFPPTARWQPPSLAPADAASSARRRLPSSSINKVVSWSLVGVRRPHHHEAVLLPTSSSQSRSRIRADLSAFTRSCAVCPSVRRPASSSRLHLAS